MHGRLRALWPAGRACECEGMSVVRTNAAAAMLGVSTNTLRSWERRFGYPMPRRTEGGHRQFELAEIEALKQALQETNNISSAISIARERGQGMATPARLATAFAAFDQAQADRLLEESLALRSVERTVESVLLPAVASLPATSAEYGFGWRYATGWLAAAQRVAPPASREEGVLIFDAAQPTDMDSLHVQALELFLRRTGLRVLALPVELEPARIGNALRALRPRAVVLSGGRAGLDVLARLVYAARQSGEVEVLDFRGALPDTGASTVARLGEQAELAAATLRELLTAPASASASVAAPAPRPSHLSIASRRAS
jgi:MerR family transcriptional regulator, light-induced transcriptional regulator